MPAMSAKRAVIWRQDSASTGTRKHGLAVTIESGLSATDFRARIIDSANDKYKLLALEDAQRGEGDFCMQQMRSYLQI